MRARHELPIDVDAYVRSTVDVVQRLGRVVPAEVAQPLIGATDSALVAERARQAVATVDEVGFLDALDALDKALVTVAESGTLPDAGVDLLDALWSRLAAVGEELVQLAVAVPETEAQRTEHKALRRAGGRVDELVRALAPSPPRCGPPASRATRRSASSASPAPTRRPWPATCRAGPST